MGKQTAEPAGKPKRITTPRVLRAQRELLDALSESIKQSDFFREEAEAQLSSVMADVWNEAERRIKTLPDRELYARRLDLQLDGQPYRQA